MNIQEQIPLAAYTTFHIGGPADYFIRVSTIDEIIKAVTWAQNKKIPFFLLGQGANILVGDKGFRGLVIKNEAKRIQRLASAPSLKAMAACDSVQRLEKPGSRNGFACLAGRRANRSETFGKSNNLNDSVIFITAESGITVAELITYTSELGLSGLEHYAGIPSSLGGALWQNLHFLSPDRKSTVFIGDIVESAKLLRISSIKNRASQDYFVPCNDVKRETVGKSYFKFEYDYSILHDTHDIVLSATLALQRKNKAEIMHTVNENIAWRNQKHPHSAWERSAGSVFKKIPTGAKALAGKEGGAGRFIEQVGLKGKHIGGAQVSKEHANFIVNMGNATAKDVRDLISLVQKKVKQEFGLLLQPEISFIGEF